MSEFDDLFDAFFNRNNKDRKNKKDNQEKKDNDSNSHLNEAKSRMMDILKNITNLNINDDVEKQIDNDLGEPDSVQFYTENGLYFEKRIWITENGHLVKLLVSETPFENSSPKSEKKQVEPKTLQEQLEIAVKDEDYIKAAALRDLINPKKKRTKKAK